MGGGDERGTGTAAARRWPSAHAASGGSEQVSAIAWSTGRRRQRVLSRHKTPTRRRRYRLGACGRRGEPHVKVGHTAEVGCSTTVPCRKRPMRGPNHDNSSPSTSVLTRALRPPPPRTSPLSTPTNRILTLLCSASMPTMLASQILPPKRCPYCSQCSPSLCTLQYCSIVLSFGGELTAFPFPALSWSGRTTSTLWACASARE